MALPATDLFNDTGADVPVVGWTQQQTTTVKQDGLGLAYVNSGAADDSVFWPLATDTFPANQYSEVILDAFSGGIARACVRCTDTTAATKDFYAATTDGDIVENTNGTIATLFNGATTFVAGDTMRCEVSDTTIALKKNGAGSDTATDATLASGQGGFGGNGGTSGVFFRSWTGDALAAVTPYVNQPPNRSFIAQPVAGY